MLRSHTQARERTKHNRGTSKASTRQIRAKKAFYALARWGRTLGLVLLLLSAFGGIAYGAYEAPFLHVSQVMVLGNIQLDPKVISEKLGLEGQHILLVDTEKAAAAVKELPRVKSASVSRRLPDAISVHIREREPWAIWQVGPAKYIIDDEGVILGADSSIGGLPIIKDMSQDKQEPQKRVDTEAVELALKLERVLPQELGHKAKEFEYVRHGGLVVITDKGGRARFGDMEDFDFKLAVWKAVLDKAAQQKLKVNHVDLRFGYRPFFR